MRTLNLPRFSALDMFVKFKTDDPEFHQIINLLKLKYRTFATSKTVKKCVYESLKINRECEILRAHNESMSAEIDRLRELLDCVSGGKYRY